MSISVICSKCNQKLSAPDDWAGKKAKCGCGMSIDIPNTPAPLKKSHQATQPKQIPQAIPVEEVAPQIDREEGEQSPPKAQQHPKRPSMRPAPRPRSKKSVPGVPCKHCEDGRAITKTVFRKSNGAVVFGFIFILLSATLAIYSLNALLFAKDLAGGITPAARQATADQLKESGAPDDIVQKVSRGQELALAELNSLNSRQISIMQGSGIVNSMTDVASDAVKGPGRIIAWLLLVPAVVLAPIGILLVLRKKILFCTKCGAVSRA